MSGYVDEVVIPYDRDLGPVLFEHYGADTAQRLAEQLPSNLLEIAAGIGFLPDICAACCPRNPGLPQSMPR